MFTIRVAEEKDWPAILNVAQQALPDAEMENKEWLDNRRRLDESELTRRHYVAETEAGDVIGYGAVEEGPEEGLCRMFLVAAPDWVTEGIADRLYQRLHEDLATMSIRIVWVREETRDPIVGYFREKGFQERTRFMLKNGREAIVLYQELQPQAV